MAKSPEAGSARSTGGVVFLWGGDGSTHGKYGGLWGCRRLVRGSWCAVSSTTLACTPVQNADLALLWFFHKPKLRTILIKILMEAK